MQMSRLTCRSCDSRDICSRQRRKEEKHHMQNHLKKTDGVVTQSVRELLLDIQSRLSRIQTQLDAQEHTEYGMLLRDLPHEWLDQWEAKLQRREASCDGVHPQTA
jgi:hypothetical protein